MTHHTLTSPVVLGSPSGTPRSGYDSSESAIMLNNMINDTSAYARPPNTSSTFPPLPMLPAPASPGMQSPMSVIQPFSPMIGNQSPIYMIQNMEVMQIEYINQVKSQDDKHRKEIAEMNEKLIASTHERGNLQNTVQQLAEQIRQLGVQGLQRMHANHELNRNAEAAVSQANQQVEQMKNELQEMKEANQVSAAQYSSALQNTSNMEEQLTAHKNYISLLQDEITNGEKTIN